MKNIKPHFKRVLCGFFALFTLFTLRGDYALAQTDKSMPIVRLQQPAPRENEMIIRIFDQGGAPGRVQIFLNGRQYAADARGLTADGRGLVAEARAIAAEGRGGLLLRVRLQGPLVRPGGENEIRVVAYNANGEAAPAQTMRWQAPAQIERSPSRLFAIVTGVSRYADPAKIASLKFAAKDARDFAQALRAVAEPIFKDRVEIHLLTGEANAPETPGLARGTATKYNVQTAFAAVAREARSQDVVVVFFAGHGVAVQQGGYYFFTQDARTVEITASPFKEWFISSTELATWCGDINAEKQVLIFDTCAAGAVTNISPVQGRDLTPDQTHAMQRLNDAVGHHVLMGSMATAASYEASRYDQGLLTYALLEGIKGRALREGKFVDVLALFHYAVERVPELAKNINGVQKPLIATPKTLGLKAPTGAVQSDSFDIGEVTEANWAQIPGAAELPQVRLTLINEKQENSVGPDRLGVQEALRIALQELSNADSFVLLDDADPPGTIAIGGRYSERNGTVTARLILRRAGNPLGEPIEVTGSSVPALVKQLAAKISVAVKSSGQ